jgi:hypothetical protein
MKLKPIYIGLALTVSGIGYLLIAKAINTKRIKKLIIQIDDGKGKYGSIRDYAKYFASTYDQYIVDKYPQYNIALLTPETVRAYAYKLKDAFSGADDFDTIYSVFQTIKSFVELSQVSSYFQAISGSSLLSKIEDMRGQDENQILDVIKKYKAFYIK